MKFKVPWYFPSESVIDVFTPSLLVFFNEHHNKECPLKKSEQFFERLTASFYI